MGKRIYYQRNKRLEKLSKEKVLDLTFDLINVFSLAKTPSESADLLKDILTADEIKDIAKRIRIAKMLIAGESQREIASSLYCSLTTVTKVSVWLQASGNGLKNIIEKLPKKHKMPNNLVKVPVEFQAPQALLATAKYFLAKRQAGKVEEFLENVESKKLTDKMLRQASSNKG